MNNDTRSGFLEDHHIYAEHPNPSWARRIWISLDGTWSLRHKGRVENVTVPFPVGSAASGVDFDDKGLFVYLRSFDLAGFDRTKSYLLHAGASDYDTTVFVNGRKVCRHIGGYASFSCDISDCVKASGNELEIRVRDSHSMGQVRGKQTFRRKPFYVWYAGFAGIWQSVWIEETGSRYISRASLRVDHSMRTATVSAIASPSRQGNGPEAGDVPGQLLLEITATAPTGETYRFTKTAVDDSFRYDFSLDEIGAALWSPERPNLYALQYRLFSDGRVIDIVDSYFGLRKIEVTGEGIRINDVTTFLRMVLVQGYYPEGGYAPRSYRRMEEDIRTIQSMGFNGARIHQKIESPYFHYLCDRLGLLTTFEMPSFYAPSKKAFRAYESELREIIERDSLHPSSIMWILFNETWGIWGIYRAHSRTRRFVMDMVALLKDKDPSRPVIDNSGWEHIRTDIADFHHYLRSSELARRVYARFRSGDPDILYKFSLSAVLAFYLFNRVGTATRSLFLERSADRDEVPRFLSEYGGFGWYEHTKGVSIVDDIETYTRDVIESDAFCGYCLTQLYDVEKETNGLLSFDRKPKIDIERMRKINSV